MPPSEVHPPKSVAVVGAGSWGTALAHLLASKGYEVRIWGRDADVVESLNRRHTTKYLPGVNIHPSLRATGELTEAVRGASMVVGAVPSQFTRNVFEQVRDHLSHDAIVVIASKGIETTTLMTMSEVMQDVLPFERHGRLCFISGPSFALEVARGFPTVVTVAGENPRIARTVQHWFHAPSFRVYTSYDVVGVELGGALKNVIAIAAGALEGIGAGNNIQAALITRGIAEMTRLGIKRGANPLTFAGLTGMGDLILTCTGQLSRNRSVGLRLGRGDKIDGILKGMDQVAEGVETSRSAYMLAQKESVELPIMEQVYRVLHEGKEIRQAIQDIMARELKAELDYLTSG
ncbi:MAG: NAD(P)-dependent glycerol-3-phosphate dehydrogenase [Deltaproteobacteria bacterium]|nr:NAD(P)-dependent glycerol-3-phosphate dehydrogenase [Deltaproteobacteria bacterium]